MKRSCIFIFCVLGLTSMAAAQRSRLTLQQCIDSAVARNITIRQRSLQSDAARVNYNQARAYVLPTVNASINHGLNQGRSIDPFTNGYLNQQINAANYSVTSELLLFNGLSIKNSIRQYAYAADAARMDQQQEEDAVTLNAILAFLQVLNSEDQAAISKAQLDVSQEQVTRLEKLNREGAISPVELFNLRGQVKGDELNLVNAINAVQTAKLTLLQLMNLPYDSTLTLQRDGTENVLQRYDATADAVYQTALDKLALVKAAELRRKSAEAAVKAERGQLFPSLALGSNLFSNYSSVARKDNLIGTSDIATDAYVLINGDKAPVMAKQNNFNSQKILYGSQIHNNISTNIGLGVRLPILNSLQTRNRIKLAQITVKTTALAEENTRLLLRQAIDQAHLNLTNAWERYKVLLEQVAAYKEAFRVTEVRFNAGIGTSVDYLIAKGRLDQANLNLVVAKYDYVLRTKVLDYYSGRQ